MTGFLQTLTLATETHTRTQVCENYAFTHIAVVQANFTFTETAHSVKM